MTQPKPTSEIARNFWIVKKFSPYRITAHEAKPEWKDLDLGDERIHVIEKSYADKLEEENKKLRETLEIMRNTFDFGSGNKCAPQNQANAREALSGGEK